MDSLRAGDPVRTEGRKKSGQRARLAGLVGASDVLVSDGGSRAGDRVAGERTDGS